MVSTVLCSWSIGDLSGVSSKCEKSDSETCSTFEDNCCSAKPIIISSEHIDLPKILRQNIETEDIFTQLLGSTNKGTKNDDNSEEIFNSHVNRNIKEDLNRKNIVDKVFEKYDDPYAKFTFSKTPKTPGPPRTLNLLLGPSNTPRTKSYKYLTLEERESRRKAAIEGQRDFCQVLIKNGIDPEEYVSSGFKTIHKTGSCAKFNFDCSTPKADTFSDCISTPTVDRYNINTPISGIKKLPGFSDEINFTPNYLSLTSCLSEVSLNKTFSPVHDLPPETKSTLLSGIVCYVDVRSENEDMSNAVQAELLTLGARIEKNFTKKVTHVVFKEGRVSTYLKAKKEEIPLVSVLWIEACKRVRGVADPAQHPPRQLEKYENILPFQTIKKRRLKFFNPNSKIRKNILENYNDPKFVPTLNGKRLATKKAATVCKDKIVESGDDKENKGIRKYCTKKLLFDKCEDLFTNENEEPGQENPEKNAEPFRLDDSSFDSMPDIKSDVLKRKSAPAKLLFKKTSKEKNINASQSNENGILKSKLLDENVIVGEKNVSAITEKEAEHFNTHDNSDLPSNIVPPKKKRKLYDPNEVYVSLDEGEVTREPVEQPVKRPRTKATAGRQLVKVAIARKRGNIKIKTDPDEDENGSSPSTFVSDSPPSVSLKNKRRREHRSVVFTSVHRSDMPKYIEMVKKLGRFVIENEVTKRTTHVVCNGPRRTLNVIKGIARGCWILDIKWLEESLANEKWLPEDSFILSNDYPCITECCRERRGLKTSHVIDIFKEVGSIYVSKAANPSKKDLDQLLKMCCANFSKSSNTADIKVGGFKPNSNSSGVWISEKWVIDSITRNSLQPFTPYNIDSSDKIAAGCSQESV